MKRILNLIYIPLLALGLSGCEDFLSVTAPDQSTSENYWKTEADATAGLSAAYSQMYYGGGWRFHEYKFTFEPFREDIIKMGPGASGYGYMTELFNFTFNMSSGTPATIWRYNYWGLSYCNQVIDKVGVMTEEMIDGEVKKQIIAEARFMRAYYHMVLLMNWDQIVVRTKYITSEGDIDKALSSRTDAWDFIVQDLEYAAGVLPVTRDAATKGRATSALSNAYLGYALLTRSYEDPAKKADYLTGAVSALKSENFAGYGLVDMKDWLGMFNGTNENSKESLLETQFSSNISGNAYYKHQTHFWVGAEALGGWEGILPSDMLFNEFKKEGKIATTGNYDSRLYSTLWFKDDYFNGNPELVWGFKYDKKFGDVNKPVFRKFLPAAPDNVAKGKMESDETSMNVMVMRYANVLLMRAEALNEQGHPEQAIPFINELRTRADMPNMTGTSQEQVKAQIEHERIVEFALEGFRFYDLRRWGKAKQALDAIGRTGFDPARHNFYFLPESEMNSNGEIK